MKEQDKKLAEIQDQLAKMLSGQTIEQARNAGTCATCTDPDLNFRDELSRREYNVSNMCQKCQDESFGEEE